MRKDDEQFFFLWSIIANKNQQGTNIEHYIGITEFNEKGFIEIGRWWSLWSIRDGSNVHINGLPSVRNAISQV